MCYANIYLVYTIDNKIAVINHRTISHTAATDITSSLQHAHSEAFLNNAPNSQPYGSASSIYRWKLDLDGARLFVETEQLKSQKL
jgi:hypothetical protein